jgi:hypothetical protein
VIRLDSPERLRLGRECLVPHLDVEALRSAKRETYRICLGVIQFKLSKQ